MTEPVHDAERWDGAERRSIPIHILNHVSDRLSEHTNKVEETFRRHTEEEMERYEDILQTASNIDEKLDAHIKASEDRHTATNQMFLSYAEKMDKMVEGFLSAFPKDADGKPDFRGHNKAHVGWMEGSDRENKLLDYVEAQKTRDEEASADLKYYKRIAVAAVVAPLSLWVATVLYKSAVPTAPVPVVQEKVK